MPAAEDRWSPLTVDDAVTLFAGAPFRWWISGGQALGLHLGRSWRPHGDLDVGVLRRDTPAIRAWLASWDLYVAAAGDLSPWDGRRLLPDRQENDVWVRRSPGRPWAFDLTIGEGTEHRWFYRRDPTVSQPWDRALRRTRSGVPYLAPDLQLLFKSSAPRPKDEIDAEMVIPALAPDERRFLFDRLPTDHRWRQRWDVNR